MRENTDSFATVPPVVYRGGMDGTREQNRAQTVPTCAVQKGVTVSDVSIIGVDGRGIGTASMPIETLAKHLTGEAREAIRAGSPVTVTYARADGETVTYAVAAVRGEAARVTFSAAVRRMMEARYGVAIPGPEGRQGWGIGYGEDAPIELPAAAASFIGRCILHAVAVGTAGKGCGITDANADAVAAGWKPTADGNGLDADRLRETRQVSRPSVTRFDRAAS